MKTYMLTEVQPTLDLSIEPNSTIEFAQQIQVPSNDWQDFMPIHVEDKKVILEDQQQR